MTDNVAVIKGYTKHVVAYTSVYELDLLVKPDVDLDSSFWAWDTDLQEFVKLSGWLWRFEYTTPFER